MDDDPRDYAIVRKVERNGKVNYKRPKIQRLVTSRRRKRKQKWLSIKKQRIHKKVANLKHYKALKQRRREKKLKRAPISFLRLFFYFSCGSVGRHRTVSREYGTSTFLEKFDLKSQCTPRTFFSYF